MYKQCFELLTAQGKNFYPHLTLTNLNRTKAT